MINLAPSAQVDGSQLFRLLAGKAARRSAGAGQSVACRSRATITCLVLGIVATLGVVLLLMPYQGHGWGYRYLHGCLAAYV